jgi:PAS domain S-box-containing protein
VIPTYQRLGVLATAFFLVTVCGDKALDKPKSRTKVAMTRDPFRTGVQRTYDRNELSSTQSISGSVLVVAACAATDAALEDPAVARVGLTIERVADSAGAIMRVEDGDAPDVVLLAPQLADPVRVAQRLHSLDREGAVVVLADAEGEADLRHALEVAPFLGGDVSMIRASEVESLVEALAAAATRTRERREAAAERKKRRETPPPLSARYLGTLLDSVPLGLITLDNEGRVIGWNKRAGEMLGVPEVEALGSAFVQLFEPDRRRLEGLIDELGSSGLDEEGQVFERGERSFEITGARFTIRSGERGTLLILQDVTKRRAAEREVELQRALMNAQADSSMVGIAVVARDGALQRINRRWTEIWGVDAELIRTDRARAAEQMLGRLVDPDRFMRGVEELAASGDGDYRDEITLKDGRTIERYGTHVHGESGEVIGRIWFHTDITAHRREEDALRFLADATNLLSSSLDYETTLQRVASLAVPRMANWCTVEIVEQGSIRSVAIAHVDPEKVAIARDFRRRYPDIDSGAVPRAIQTGQSQVFKELTAEQMKALATDDEHLRMLEALELRSVMVVPIQVRDRVFGAINFIRCANPPYDDEDVKLAEELARRAAMAIDNSRVHAELRDTARTLQESLLPPHLPAVRGLELAARFRPAGVGMQVGGDFYDIFETGPDQWAIAVGDVCGKGAEAAALTALTRYTVRAAAMYEETASGVLRVLNQALLRQRGDYRFTTLAFCVLDLSGARPTLSVACGGHPRPLLLRPDGSASAIGAVGPLLGVLADANFSDEQIQLEENDLLALYTDGLTDALAPRQMLDEEALLAALAGCADMSPAEVSQRLELTALGGDVDAVPRDDIALVVAKLG